MVFRDFEDWHSAFMGRSRNPRLNKEKWQMYLIHALAEEPDLFFSILKSKKRNNT